MHTLSTTLLNDSSVLLVFPGINKIIFFSQIFILKIFFLQVESNDSHNLFIVIFVRTRNSRKSKGIWLIFLGGFK